MIKKDLSLWDGLSVDCDRFDIAFERSNGAGVRKYGVQTRMAAFKKNKERDFKGFHSKGSQSWDEQNDTLGKNNGNTSEVERLLG